MFPLVRSKKDFIILLGDLCFFNEEKRLFYNKLYEILGINDPINIAKLILIAIQIALADKEGRYNDFYNRKYVYYIRNEKNAGYF